MEASSISKKRYVRGPYRLLKRIVDVFVVILTTSRGFADPAEATNVASLKKRLRMGDVVLVSGTARISYVVKVLTLSPWSHVVMYVGDRRDLLSEKEINEWTERFGAEALKHLVIDADPVRRVHLKPLDDFAGLTIRQCRAAALAKEDLDKVVANALSQLGRQYDIKHIIRLLFFFAFPWELLPESWRAFITDFTLSENDRICSRVLSEAFHSVGYPIRPVAVMNSRGPLRDRAIVVAAGLRSRRRSAVKLLLGGRVKKAMGRLADTRYTEIHLRGARHITPADYDLSRFFSIIKDDDDLKFNYRRAKALCPINPH